MIGRKPIGYDSVIILQERSGIQKLVLLYTTVHILREITEGLGENAFTQLQQTPSLPTTRKTTKKSPNATQHPTCPARHHGSDTAVTQATSKIKSWSLHCMDQALQWAGGEWSAHGRGKGTIAACTNLCSFSRKCARRNYLSDVHLPYVWYVI